MPGPSKTKTTSPASELIPREPARFIGVVFAASWALSLLSGNLLPAGGDLATQTIVLDRFLALGAAMLAAWALLLTAIGAVPLARKRVVLAAVGITGAFGNVTVILACMLTVPDWFSALGFPLSGACCAVCAIAWCEFLATQPLRQAITILVVGIMAGSLLSGLEATAPDIPGLAAAILSPLLATLTLAPPRGTRFMKNASSTTDNAHGVVALVLRDHPPMLLTLLACIAAVFGCLRAAVLAPNQATMGIPIPLVICADVLAGAVILGILLRLLRIRRLITGFYASIPLLAAALVILYVNPGAVFALTVLAKTGFGLAALIVWVEMVQSSHVRKLPTVGLFILLFEALLAGFAIGQALKSLAPWDHGLLCLVLMCLLLAAALLLMSLDGKLEVSQELLDAPKPTSIEARTMALAEAGGLSPRETDVLLIWLQGHNAQYVEDTLHISRNTVKTHLNHIYQKLGVSSREELLAKCDEKTS